jgi:hypothetical protein
VACVRRLTQGAGEQQLQALTQDVHHVLSLCRTHYIITLLPTTKWFVPGVGERDSGDGGPDCFYVVYFRVCAIKVKNYSLCSKI